LEIGFDLPHVRIEVILATTSNMNQVIQRIGRVIRKHEGKDLALIYVIYVSDTKDDNIHELVKKAVTTDSRQEYRKEEELENNKMEIKEKNIILNNNNNNSKRMKKTVERKRLEKAYNIIESTLFEPMIVEIREEKEGRQQQDSSQENAENQSQIEKKRLFRVRSSIKEKNKYYEVDIENGTCTCPDFKFKLNKCKHIVATELFLF
jgi:superfamily II DNA or RNA helicase